MKQFIKSVMFLVVIGMCTQTVPAAIERAPINFWGLFEYADPQAIVPTYRPSEPTQNDCHWLLMHHLTFDKTRTKLSTKDTSPENPLDIAALAFLGDKVRQRVQTLDLTGAYCSSCPRNLCTIFPCLTNVIMRGTNIACALDAQDKTRLDPAAEVILCGCTQQQVDFEIELRLSRDLAFGRCFQPGDTITDVRGVVATITDDNERGWKEQLSQTSRSVDDYSHTILTGPPSPLNQKSVVRKGGGRRMVCLLSCLQKKRHDSAKSEQGLMTGSDSESDW